MGAHAGWSSYFMNAQMHFLVHVCSCLHGLVPAVWTFIPLTVCAQDTKNIGLHYISNSIAHWCIQCLRLVCPWAEVLHIPILLLTSISVHCMSYWYHFFLCYILPFLKYHFEPYCCGRTVEFIMLYCASLDRMVQQNPSSMPKTQHKASWWLELTKTVSLAQWPV